VVDVITATDGTSFTLVETWVGGVLSLDTYTASAGSVVTSTSALTWSVSSAISTTQYALTKTWAVASSGWTSGTLTETLTTSSGTSIAIDLAQATATPEPTNEPTYTPAYTPIPWEETPYPTPTACAGIDCSPTVPRISYMVFMPLVYQNSE
jgi:hypothetical protein